MSLILEKENQILLPQEDTILEGVSVSVFLFPYVSTPGLLMNRMWRQWRGGCVHCSCQGVGG